MVRRVVSLLRSAPAALRGSDPALEANAYAVAEDVDLTVLLIGDGIERALAAGEVRPGTLGGVPLAPSVAARDLRGLIESGVAVLVSAESLAAGGLTDGDLVDGTEVVDDNRIADLLRDAEAVVTW